MVGLVGEDGTLVGAGLESTYQEQGFVQPFVAGDQGETTQMGQSTGSTFAVANEIMYAGLAVVPRGLKITKLKVKVQSAGEADSVIRMGAYDLDASGHPDSLLDDAGTVAADSTGLKSITGLSIEPASGDNRMLWVVCGVQGAPTTQPALFRNEAFQYNVALSNANGIAEQVDQYLRETGVSGALPASFSPSNLNVGSGPIDQMPTIVISYGGV